MHFERTADLLSQILLALLGTGFLELLEPARNFPVIRL
jgi:hypothetical protein